MSDVAPIVDAVPYEGAVTVTALPPRGMITLRGDLSTTVLQNAATDVAGVAFPEINVCNCEDEAGIAWMSPDEVMVMMPFADRVRNLERLRKTLSKTHHILADVSDARMLFRIEGASPDVRRVMAKLTPVDLRDGYFGLGSMRRTHVGQVAAGFWMRDATCIELMCFRSVADYMWDLLRNAAA